MDWLPELIPLSDYGGDFHRYVEAVYRIFRRDFVLSQPLFRGRRCYCDTRMDTDGKEAGFWHVVTEGSIESERMPALRRCERIAWPRAIVEAADTPLVNIWEAERRRPGKGRQVRLSLAPSDFSYLVVIRATSHAYVLVTAFYLEHEHQRKKKRREYESSQNS
ncbi:MAG TPA: hypothetical protein VEK57_01085 [Thermoanaerobaculia bacterium]|nr:hypothetical protein [Thermoanaerobaculia bacterium]